MQLSTIAHDNIMIAAGTYYYFVTELYEILRPRF